MSESVSTDKVLSTPIGKFEGCDIFIISAENGETVIQTGKYSEPRPISLEFTESIFSPFVTGKLVIDIPNGILEEGNARITSQDLLIFKLKIPFSLTTDDFIPPIEPSGVFFISSVTQTSSSEKTTTFEMTFMSIEGLNDLTTRIAKSYNKMKRSDIVIDIYDEYIKENAELSQVTDTLHSDFCCVLPNWSPSKCIKWLSTGSMDSGNPECTNFFFFQRFNPDGELETIFTSLDDMIEEPTMGEEGRLESGYIVDILNDEEDPKAHSGFLETSRILDLQTCGNLPAVRSLTNPTANAMASRPTCPPQWSAAHCGARNKRQHPQRHPSTWHPSSCAKTGPAASGLQARPPLPWPQWVHIANRAVPSRARPILRLKRKRKCA